MGSLSGLSLLLSLLVVAPAATTNGRINSAVDAYTQGKALFEAGEREQALVEFKRSFELSGNVEALFGIAQSEYHLGRLKDARTHYQQYIDSAKGTAQGVQIAKLRVEAINRRGGVISINTQPLEVNVSIEPVRGGGTPINGQAPNDFQVERGVYRVRLSKDRYVSEQADVVIESGETKSLFFALEQRQGRLEISTVPREATLYVRGNRARNPYLQNVEPGVYEIYAEATDYEPKTETYVVAPGESRPITFRLNYVQRSGRPELIGFWTAAGAVAGGTAVYARLNSGRSSPAAAESTTVVAGAALVGGVAGALSATAFVPGYIRDNLALFRIGAAWIGAVEGATLGLAYRKELTSAWVGGVAGLTAGALTGILLDDRAPNYGRVASIQSGAAIGALSGALLVPTLTDDDGDPTIPPSWAVFGGLNLGLGVGLALAYLPEQGGDYGTPWNPSWQRVLLIDLATAAGAVGGALVEIWGRCLPTSETCSFQSNEPEDRRRIARSALLGGAVGLIAGWALTSNYDKGRNPTVEQSPVTSFVPLPTMLPVEGSDGSMRAVPGLAAMGRF